MWILDDEEQSRQYQGITVDWYVISVKVTLPDPLHSWLWCVSLRGYSSGRLHVELPRADGISLHVGGEGGVHALVLRQDHGQTKAGSSILKNLHLVTVTGPDALAIFVPSNLMKDKMSL